MVNLHVLKHSLEKLKFYVVLWFPFQDFPVSSILLGLRVALSSSFKPENHFRWSTPPLDLYKFNFDGSAVGNPCLTGLGGIILDGEGLNVLSFTSLVGICSIDKVEL